MTSGTARSRVQALAQGRGDGGAIAVPLALAPAARIQERGWEEFTEDPTQLANGLRDLHQAVAPDGLVVSSPDLLLEQMSGGLMAGRHAQAAVEASRRLRTSLGDLVVLVACLPAPGQVDPDELLEAGKELLAAGADVLLVFGEASAGRLGTLANVARFHQAMVAVVPEASGGTEATEGLPTVVRRQLDAPEPAAGLVVTDRWLDRDTDLSALEDWVDEVRG